jgi:O-antigen ligase
MKELLHRLFAIAEARSDAIVALFVLLGLALRRDLGTAPAAVSLLVAAGLAFLNPPAGLGAALMASPFIFDPVLVGAREFTLLELALVALAAGLVGRILVDAALERSLREVFALLRPWSVTAGAIALVAVSAISLAVMPDNEFRDASVRVVRRVILEPLVVIAAARWAYQRGRLMVPLASLGAMLCFSAVWGAEQVILGRGVAADGVHRATGPYEHPNNFAFFLERSTLLVAIPLLLTERWRRIGAILALVGVVATLSTVSRGALIGLPVGIAIALWLSGRLKAVTGVAAGFLALVGAFAVFAGNRLFDSGGEGSEPSRLLIWRAALRMIRDFPYTGIGLDQFFIMYGTRYIEPAGWPERYTSHPHNIVLDFWLSLGLAGLALMIVAVVWMVIRTWRMHRLAVDDRSTWAIAGAAALAAGLVHGLVDNSFFLPDLAVLTWFSITLLAVQGRTRADLA